MCNLSQGIYDDGFKAGYEKGKIETAVNVINKLIAKGFSLEEALAVADIDKETYEKNKDM